MNEKKGTRDDDEDDQEHSKMATISIHLISHATRHTPAHIPLSSLSLPPSALISAPSRSSRLSHSRFLSILFVCFFILDEPSVLQWDESSFIRSLIVSSILSLARAGLPDVECLAILFILTYSSSFPFRLIPLPSFIFFRPWAHIGKDVKVG